jgi:hypothetical protein
VTKREMLEALAGLPDDTELEIHLEHDGGSADYVLEAIGEVIGAVNPPWFTFRVGELVSDCG